MAYISQFEDFLQQELFLAQQIQALMLKEQTALSDNQIEVLEQLRPLSVDAVNMLKAHSSKRLVWMQQHNLPLNASCLSHPDLNNAVNIRRLWQTLEQQYLSNQKLSAKLAEIVLASRLRAQQKIRILQGRQNAPQLYNNKGEASRLGNGSGYIQA